MKQYKPTVTQHRHATLYPLGKLDQANAYGQRLTALRREAAQTWDPEGYLRIQRKTREIAGRLLVLLDSLTDAETLAWGAELTRQNFGGPVL